MEKQESRVRPAIAPPGIAARGGDKDGKRIRPGAGSANREHASPPEQAMTPKHVLLLSVSAGAGHTRAAEAIRAAASGAPDVTATHLDVMKYMPAGLHKLHTDFYIGLLNRHPSLWGHLYQITQEARPGGSTQRLRRAIAHLASRGLLRDIDALRPDAIVCTHFLPAEILSNAHGKRRPPCPVWVQVTDFSLHRMWVQQHMAGYFAANDEVAFRIRAWGVAPERIHVTGIPVMPAFAQAGERAACAAQWGLDPGRPTFLLMGGGAGLGKLEGVAGHLLACGADCQLVAVAGRNARALERLQALARRHPGRLLALGYCEQVERLMACADLVITKPGGLTSSECLAMGVPMLLNAAIPGLEERNADYLLEQGVALKAFDELTLRYRVGHLLAHPEKLADMGRRAKALGRPGAAGDVLATVLA